MTLVEREEELQALNTAFDACVQGSGQLVIVSGTVGGGKTTLLQAFVGRVAGRGAALLTATGSWAERTQRFGVLRQLAQGHGVTCPGEWGFQALDDLCLALLKLAGEQPVVIAVDDVHLADDASLDALLYLQRRLRFARALLVFTEGATLARPYYDAFHAEATRQARTSHVQLYPLSPAGVARLLESRTDPATAHALAARCHALSGGNPLLAYGLAADQCVLRRRGGPSSDGEPVVGREFGRAVTACLHRSEPGTLETARGLAVLDGAPYDPPAGNHPFCTSVISAMLGMSAAEVEQHLGLLREAELLDDGRFRHQAARAAVLEGLPPARLAELHLRAADVLHAHDDQMSRVAHHLVAADELGVAMNEDWGVEVLRHAAQEDLAVGLIDNAAQRLDLAARSSADEAERAEVTSLLLRVEWLQKPSVAVRHLNTLRNAQADGRLAEDDALALAKFLLWYGHVDELTETLTDFAASLRTDRGHLGLAVHWLAFLCPPAAVGVAGLEVPSRTVPAGNAWIRTVAMLDGLRNGARAKEIVDMAEDTLRTCRLSEQTFDMHVAALVALLYAERPDRAAHWSETLLADVTTRRAQAWEGMLNALYGLALLRQGDLSHAAEHAGATYNLLSPQGWGATIWLPLAVRVATATRMGRHDEAAALLHVPVPDSMFETQMGLHYLFERGLHYLATDRVRAALADFRRCGELARDWNLDLPALVPWRLGAAEAHLALGDPASARDLAAEQLAHPGPGGLRSRGMALRILAAASAPGEQRVQRLQESVDLLDTCGDRYETACSLLQLSRVYGAIGDAERSRATARRAAQLAALCGAEGLLRAMPYAAAVGESMGRTGQRPVMPSPAMLSTLSEAELRVAELASLGHSNKEIGGRLSITVSTVEQHLTRVYRKLGVKRRADLPTDLQQFSRAGESRPLCFTGAGRMGITRSRGVPPAHR